MGLTLLQSVDDVVKALGGTAAVARMVGVKGPQAVTNWKAQQYIPCAYYVFIGAALEDRGYRCRLDLFPWKPIDVVQQAAA